MKTSILFFTFLISVFFSLNAQVPTPMSTTSSWTKNSDNSYTIKDKNGVILNNLIDLAYLKTDTLSVLDKSTRTLYLLADFKSAPAGTKGEAIILARNIGRNFYITNKHSFAFYVDSKYQKGVFSNIQGSYVYYLELQNASYYFEGIREFAHWGAKTVYKMEDAPENTYWYRDVEKKSYGVIKKGKTIDYSLASTEKEGDNLIVKIDGVKTYILPNYYNTTSYIFKPVKKYFNNITTNNDTGCVKGNCDNGWGKWQYANGHYDGFWFNGKKSGYGLYKWNGNGKYIGNWKNDAMNGYGVYIAENKDNIIGEYKNGQLNGLGITVKESKWSQGIFVDGNLKTAYSFITTKNETGCIAGDCQNKYGRMSWSNGDTFTGFFKDGNMYMGTYKFASGDKFSGMFNSKNQFHGTGRFFFKDKSYYGGEWKNGKYHGKGYYHDSDLKQKIGEWENGQLVKQ